MSLTMFLPGGETSALEPLRALALQSYGNFTTVRVGPGGVRGLRLHLERLERDAAALFGLGVPPGLVREGLRGVVSRARAEGVDLTARLTLFDPRGELGRPGRAEELGLLVSVRPAPEAAAAPAGGALAVQTRSFRREMWEIKHVSLGPALYERRCAQRAGFDDALFVGPAGGAGEGCLLEGPTWSFGLLAGGRLLFPAAGALPGVTRRLVGEAAEAAGLTVAGSDIPVGELEQAEGAVALNAVMGVRPVDRVDGFRLPESRALAERLGRLYGAVPPESAAPEGPAGETADRKGAAFSR